MISKYWRPLLAWLWVVVLVAFILGFSGQSGEQSGSLSKSIVNFCLRLFGYEQPEALVSYDFWHLVLRKTAHFSEYLLLCVSVILALRISGLRNSREFLLALVFCLALASLDEFLQTRTVGRSGQASDVFIDMCGVGVGILIYRLSILLKTHKNS